ncbi:cytochrome P450 [Penicillium verhagenii]|nr:cytochrome P450 [Penicillium verhagenii]
MSLTNAAQHLYTVITPTILGVVAVISATAFVVSRLYLHPLSKFPGPRIAALTRWYEFYHDVVLDGTYVKYYPKLHQKYGPIVRIAPNHLHVNDPEFYKEVFKSQTNFLKPPYFYSNLGISDSLVGICDPHKHRLRRTIINPLFSKQAMERTMPIVQDTVENAANILRARYKEGKSTDIQKLYRCITVDVISRAVFGHSQDLTAQDENDIYPPFLASLDLFTKNLGITKHFTFINKIALSLPEKYAEKLSPGYQSFRNQCEKWINAVKTRHSNGVFKTDDGRDTVFDLLLEPNDKKGYQVPDMTELVDEAFLLLLAGSDTTAYSLACATYYLLTHEEVLLKLKAELDGVPRLEGGRLDCRNIQSLPYLTCVVKESLRLSSAVPGNLPRVVPPEGANVQGNHIPGGSIVSISTRIIHDNADLFPEPEKFKPERWLGEKGRELERWNVTFSKGPRACAGINLAYLEIYMILAIFFSDFDLSLYQTDADSMEWLDHGFAINKSNVTVHARPLRV